MNVFFVKHVANTRHGEKQMKQKRSDNISKQLDLEQPRNFIIKAIHT